MVRIIALGLLFALTVACCSTVRGPSGTTHAQASSQAVETLSNG